MNKPKISLISCISKNRGIGKDNKLLFDIPEDLQRFKKITMGHPIIMGFRTFESIGQALPGRLNIVLSKNDIDAPGATVCQSIDKAIEIANKNDNEEIFFIGGGSVYEQAIELADKLYLTIVDAEVPADTFFPDYSDFKKIIREENKESDKYKYRFLELER